VPVPEVDLSVSGDGLGGWAETDADGRFQINLLPGVYKAVAAPLATPNERPFATATTQFTVLSSSPVQAGATLSVQPSFSVQGNVLTPRREGARGALVSAEVSPARVTSTVFDRAIGEVPTLPRSASDIIEDTSGAFQFFAEPGVYDFSVRPPANSGFAWLVIPGLEPAVNAAANNSLDLDLSELHLPPPLPLELHVAWPARPDSAELLTGASVRAYALIDATLEKLTAGGTELIDERPRTGIRGSRVAFLHPRSTGGVLTEIVEPHA
jgi:hypothetical protein